MCFLILINIFTSCFSLLQSPGDSDIEDSDPEGEGMSPDPKEGGASSSATSTKKEDSKSTPPQIYPWMKRVHLGQSKCLLISLQRICDGNLKVFCYDEKTNTVSRINPLFQDYYCTESFKSSRA